MASPQHQAGGETYDAVVLIRPTSYELKPRFELHTLLLWLVPPLVLVGGGLGLWLHIRRRGRDTARVGDAPKPLSADEQARLDKLLAAEGAERKS